MDIIISVSAAILTAILLWKPFFSDLENFIDCIKFWITPDIWSLFRNNYFADIIAEFKLGAWLGISALTGFSVYTLFH